MMKRQTISLIFSDPIQINGLKWLDDHSESSLQHLKALDRRTINLLGEVTAKTFPIRIKKECIFNVSTSSIYEYRFAVMPSYCDPQDCRLRGARSRSNAHYRNQFVGTEVIATNFGCVNVHCRNTILSFLQIL